MALVRTTLSRDRIRIRDFCSMILTIIAGAIVCACLLYLSIRVSSRYKTSNVNLNIEHINCDV